MNDKRADAIAEAERVLRIARTGGDRSAVASALRDLTDICSTMGWTAEAMELLEQWLALARDVGDREDESVTLSHLGLACSSGRQWAKAIGLQRQAIAIAREIGDRAAEGAALNNLGIAYREEQPLKAIDELQQALAIARELGNQQDEATVLSNLGSAYSYAGRDAEAIPLHEQAASLHRQLGDRAGEAMALSGVATSYDALGERARALALSEEALAAAVAAEHLYAQCTILTQMGAICANTTQYGRAYAYYERSLAMARALDSPSDERIALSGLGAICRQTFRSEEAIRFQTEALDIARRIGSHRGEVHALLELGLAHWQLSDYATSIALTENGFTISRERGDRWGMGNALNNLGTLYWQLRQIARAKDYYEQALAIQRELRDLHMEAVTLCNLGSIHRELKNAAEATACYEEALAAARRLGDRSLEGSILGNLGTLQRDQGQIENAIALYQQGLAIERAVGSRGPEGTALNNLAEAYLSLEQYAKAFDLAQDALVLHREIGNRAGETDALQHLMVAAFLQNHRRQAVILGKQAMNVVQHIRHELLPPDAQTRATFLNENELLYRTLSDLLIAENRLAEAQQVLHLLKEREFFEFVRRDASQRAPDRIDFTPAEQAWNRRYDEIGGRLAALGMERRTLLESASRTAEQESRLEAIEHDLALAGEAFHRFLGELEEDVSAHVLAPEKLEQVKDSEALMETLHQLGPGTVALYTLVMEDRLRLLLVTPDVVRSFESPVGRVALDAAVVAFRESLADPHGSPQPLAQTLYRVLLAPLENELRDVNASTLMWSLDGALRYLPIAALHDGERYLVERIRNVVFTPASNANLKDAPAAEWQALGLGVTKPFHGLPPLPGVRRELEAIVRDEVKGTRGVLPGEISLDEAFTRRRMLRALRGRYHVVHVASHFEFRPGNELDSWLLLGDGAQMTLADVRTLSNPFGGVDLLTLSACDTARGGTGADGREIEGFAVLAQRKGAKAVIAALWPVADESTSQLMQMFYRLRETAPRASKAEALRQAQLSLLRSEAYGEPYYWAPFILLGNWL